MTKKTYYLSMMVIIVNLLFILYIQYLMFYPFEVVYIQQPFQVIGEECRHGFPHVNAGENLKFYVNYQKYKDVTAYYEKYFVCTDGYVTSKGHGHSDLPMDQNSVISDYNNIPQEISGKTCKLVFDNFFQVTPLKQVHQNVETEWFIVD
jgi:hypothetical protein